METEKCYLTLETGFEQWAIFVRSYHLQNFVKLPWLDGGRPARFIAATTAGDLLSEESFPLHPPRQTRRALYFAAFPRRRLSAVWLSLRVR